MANLILNRKGEKLFMNRNTTSLYLITNAHMRGVRWSVKLMGRFVFVLFPNDDCDQFVDDEEYFLVHSNI